MMYRTCVCAAVLQLAAVILFSKDAGSQAPAPQCAVCECGAACPTPSNQEASAAGTSISITEGNLTEKVTLSRLSGGGAGSLRQFDAVYNTYNADGSRAQIDAVMGYGWTHLFNTFLFSQLGSMFRYDGEGRITRYPLQSGESYPSEAGYFEVLTRNSDDTFRLRQKDGTTWLFARIPETRFLVGGPVWRLISITDRNGNTTTLTYVAGDLARVTDAYGRSYTFTYNVQHKLTSVTDPVRRVTTFEYDTTGRKLLRITDADGKTTTYTYNLQYQLTGKTDRDSRRFSFLYSAGKPIMVTDNAGHFRSRLSNPNNWATDETALARYQQRRYQPSATQVRDGRGMVWKHDYDANGYLTRSTAPDGSATSWTYDASTLQVSSRTDANGNRSEYSYDSRGNLIRMKDAAGNVTTYTYEPVYNMMTSQTDARGRTTTYTYDERGNRISEKDPLGNVRSWIYDAHGNVTTETDKNGNTTAYEYSSFGFLIRKTDAEGNATSMTTDQVGNIVTRTDANGHTTRFSYDAMNRLVEHTDARGKIERTEYDAEGHRTKIVDRNGNVTTFAYDLRGRMIRKTDALGRSDTFAYDGNDNLIAFNDRNGNTTRYNWDGQNRRIRVTDPLGNVASSAYDPAGNLVAETDQNGRTTRYAYDVLNRRVSALNPLGQIIRMSYDGGTMAGCALCGRAPGSNVVTAETDPLGRVVYYKYDALGRQVAIVRKVGSTDDVITASDSVTRYTWDLVGNRRSHKTPNGHTTVWDYDKRYCRTKTTNAAGDVTESKCDGVGNVVFTGAANGNRITTKYDEVDRVIHVTDSVGVTAVYTYDAVGNRLTETNGLGQTISTQWDALHRPIVSVDALGSTVRSEYDPIGNVIKRTDRNGLATTYTYDALRRCLSATDAQGHRRAYQYDRAGNLVKVTDSNGNSTRYLYDALNRRSHELFADGSSRVLTYDAAGNIATRTNGGRTVRYSYNDLNFLTERSYPDGMKDTFAFDLGGRMVSARRGGWTVSFAYDGADRLIGTVQNGRTISYEYDIRGRTRTVGYPGGRKITEHTDLRTRLTQIESAGSGAPVAEYGYNAGNRVTSRLYGNGTRTAWSHNDNGWITGVEHSLGSTRIAGFEYQFDREGNPQYEKKLHDPSRSDLFAYDSRYQLVKHTVGYMVGILVPSPVSETTYEVNAEGNWNRRTRAGIPEVRVHNNVNQLITQGPADLTYDDGGNLGSDRNFTYRHDEENRIVSVMRKSDSTVVGTYEYDALGRRVKKVASANGTPVTTFYFYDVARPIEEQSPLGETLATYVYGNYVDEVLAMERNGRTAYYHQNHLWSVAAVTGNDGRVLERYNFDAYGQPTVTDGQGTPVAVNAWRTPHSAIDSPWMFTSRQLDEESGIYFMRARYYDADKGRFLERDAAGDGINPYLYVENRPTVMADPTGNPWPMWPPSSPLPPAPPGGIPPTPPPPSPTTGFPPTYGEPNLPPRPDAALTLQLLWSAAYEMQLGPAWLGAWGSIQGIGGLGVAAVAPLIGVGIGTGIGYLIDYVTPGVTGPATTACCASGAAAKALRMSTVNAWGCKNAMRQAEAAAKTACAALGAGACTGTCPPPATCLPSFNPHDYNDVPGLFSCEATVWYDCHCRC